MGLAAGAPALAVAEVFVWRSGIGREWQCYCTVALVLAWWGLSWAARSRTLFSLGTFANMVGAIREGDYSVRVRGGSAEDGFGELAGEINQLSESLRQTRVGGLEATALLDRVVATIASAVFAFDGEDRLRLVNPAGARLLARPAERLLGQTAAALQLEEWLEGEEARVQEHTFPGAPGRWEIRHTNFRQQGRPHRLLMITDLSEPLREQERQAWRQLIRVLGHEINNTLAPVMSLADSLQALLAAPEADWEQDMARGLSIISARAAALHRFIDGYMRLARLPAPAPQRVRVRSWVDAAAALERRLAVQVTPGPELDVNGDPDQLEQVLINLLRNAVDAALESGGGAAVGWRLLPAWLEVSVLDEGPGLSSTANLFAPFFTTKPGGSGIGLALCRQIVEAHGGRLTLANRSDRSGCEARLYLPLDGAAAARIEGVREGEPS